MDGFLVPVLHEEHLALKTTKKQKFKAPFSLWNADPDQRYKYLDPLSMVLTNLNPDPNINFNTPTIPQ
jgi:hypothetical protein